MRGLAYALRDALGEGDVDTFGSILHRNWELKRTLAGGVSDPELDALYARALRAGRQRRQAARRRAAAASCCSSLPAERHAALRAAAQPTLRETPFRFAASGSHIQLFEDSDR
jgi:D-glycero-alpha-D-manno-heptose-7-phosphate kinase